MKKISISNRWKIVLIATIVNVLMEYSLRGINNFKIVPILSLVVFLNYFFYLALIEDLIGRFKLKDYQIFVAALFFGVLWQLIGPSGVYLLPHILGINWTSLLFVNFIWWCPIQTILAFYIANRITPRREWQSLLSKRGWLFAFVMFLLVTYGFRLVVPNFPGPTLPLLATMLTIIAATAIIFITILPKKTEQALTSHSFKKSNFLDILSLGLIIYLFFLSSFSQMNQPKS